VAGIAALYLQKYPTATALQVKQAITACAKQDVYTGNNLPNNYWGYGKVDALATLTHCVSSVPENSTALQHKLLIFPNPSYSGSVINIDVITIQNFDKIQIKIYNALGELVKTITVNSSSIQFNNSLVPGTYFCHLQINGSAITTEKLVIL
jgi:subtilisin family serine protease